MQTQLVKTLLNWSVLLFPFALMLFKPGVVGEHFYEVMALYLVVLLLWGYSKWESWHKAALTVGITVAIGLLLASIIYYSRRP